MSYITLISDLGTTSYRIAQVKLALAQFLQSSDQVIDVTHEIPVFNIRVAAFVIKQVFDDLPTNSINLVSIDDDVFVNKYALLIEVNGKIFIGPDNGVFSLAFSNFNPVYYKIKIPSTNFPLKDFFPLIVRKLIDQIPLNEIGEKSEDIKQLLPIEPTYDGDDLRGTVLYIDHYGNVITNISKSLFEKIGQGRNFTLYLGRFEKHRSINNFYGEVPVGEKLIYFNSSGYLEIALNKSNASKLLGLKLDSIITIEFEK